MGEGAFYLEKAMPKRNKVRPGKKDDEIKRLRDENRVCREHIAGLEKLLKELQAKPETDKPFDPTMPPPGVTRQDFRTAVNRIYIEYGGEDLDTALANTHSKLRAFKSQINAAEWGGQGWGPLITPWEDRMNASLLVKLKREKARLLAEAEKEYHILHAEGPSEDEHEDEWSTPAKPAPAETGNGPKQKALSFQPDEAFKASFLAWLKDGSNEKPKGADEVLESMRFHEEHRLPPPPDLLDLSMYVYKRQDQLEEVLAPFKDAREAEDKRP